MIKLKPKTQNQKKRVMTPDLSRHSWKSMDYFLGRFKLYVQFRDEQTDILYGDIDSVAPIMCVALLRALKKVDDLS